MTRDIIKTLAHVRDDLQQMVSESPEIGVHASDYKYNYICNAVKMVPKPDKTPEIIEATLVVLRTHRPSESLFQVIYNHPYCIKNRSNEDDDPAWWLHPYTNEVRMQKIMYLNLLINKLLEDQVGNLV